MCSQVWCRPCFGAHGSVPFLIGQVCSQVKWCDIEQKWCKLEQKWCDLEHEWCDLEYDWEQKK